MACVFFHFLVLLDCSGFLVTTAAAQATQQVAHYHLQRRRRPPLAPSELLSQKIINARLLLIL